MVSPGGTVAAHGWDISLFDLLRKRNIAASLILLYFLCTNLHRKSLLIQLGTIHTCHYHHACLWLCKALYISYVPWDIWGFTLDENLRLHWCNILLRFLLSWHGPLVLPFNAFWQWNVGNDGILAPANHVLACRCSNGCNFAGNRHLPVYITIDCGEKSAYTNKKEDTCDGRIYCRTDVSLNNFESIRKP